jgi:L-rhamnose isomerase / sugar isomerase
LTATQDSLDAMAGHRLIKQAYNTHASPILAEARRRKGGAIDPLSIYRASGYRAAKAVERPVSGVVSAGIV